MRGQGSIFIPHEALSHVWGDLEAIASIVIHGHQPSNLASILRHLRY